MTSTMSGPIPAHPYYDKSGTDPALFLDLPRPRVRPEAQNIYNQAQGSVGMVLQIEGHRMPSGFSRNKKEPKDHISENVKRMRQVQRQTRKKEADKEEHQPKPVKALWKSSKYENVSSRVRENLSRNNEAPRPHSAHYLRAHSRTGFIPQSARPASTEPSEEKLSVPKAQTAREIKLIRRDIDFIKLNGKNVKNVGMRKSPSMNALDDLKKWHEEEINNYKKGSVPKYLQTRKKQWEEEEQERLRSIPDPEMPEGHRLMSNAERLETLEKLKTTEKELQTKIASLPPRTDTLRIRRQKEELEAKMQEVEEAIRIFSRKKVFVKLEN